MEEEEEDSFDSMDEQPPKKNKLQHSQKHEQLYQDLKTQKSSQKQQMTDQIQQQKDKHFRQMGLEEVKEDATRKVTREILKNKGLVRSRRKDKRNSRVKHKVKYEKALGK